MPQDSYDNPLISRYASKEMSYLFSPQAKHEAWRRLWIALAKAEKELGLPITDSQIDALIKTVTTIDFARIAQIEEEVRHDVMAHILAYGECAPEAKPIIHLGATSCYVTDNGDLIQMRSALKLLAAKLVKALNQLSLFADQYATLPCLSFTHLQAAQPTTVGKRATLWIQDLLFDLEGIEETIENLRFLGVKGATGSQASFLALFQGNSEKVRLLDMLVAKEMDFSHVYTVTGQTYPRKQDIHIFSSLAGIGVSAHKFATDLRLLSFMKEVEEPFTTTQVGSSAMPYKRNPIRSERLCALSRFLISLQANTLHTAANQWLERTLDDSANRRLTLAEGFLTADGILNLIIDIAGGLIVNPKVIARHLEEELPFIASENILMESVKKGKDRQAVHERLREHSLASAKRLKEEGGAPDFLQRASQDPAIGLTEKELAEIVKGENFVGRSAEQVSEFLSREVEPLLRRYKESSAPESRVIV